MRASAPLYDQHWSAERDMVIMGIALLLVGAGLLIAEAHLPTYGGLGVAGLISLVAGGALAVDASGGGIAVVVVVSALLAVLAGLVLVAAVRGAAGVARKRTVTGPEALVGQVGVVRRELEPFGQVFVDGALWRARPCWEEPEALHEGEAVVVERVQGLTLSVRRAEEWELES
jgi:membrane-bound ClpP family serine protease